MSLLEGALILAPDPEVQECHYVPSSRRTGCIATTDGCRLAFGSAKPTIVQYGMRLGFS
jgi:hypothetical protein